MRIRTYKEIIDSNEDVIYIDLRTKKEHLEETIPGSYNVPIFSDEQREIIGTLYKQVSPKEATRQAVLFISERIPFIFKEIDELDKMKKTLVFFCARGGMRSSSIVGLLTGLKYNCCKLDFGYKGYREYINENLPKVLSEVNFITLYGKTGTGKTNILNLLEEKGLDVLDLEKCANHRGSILGQIGLNKQNSQKMFESLIYHKLVDRKSNLIFTEGESKRIGRIVMKDFIYDKLLESKKILIDAPLEFRKEVIKKDYINDNFKTEELIAGLEKLRRYIGKTKIDNLIDLANNNNFDEIIEELMINYYDLNYKCNDASFDLIINNDDYEKTCNELVKIYNKLI